jgi:1-aminocyclopropane-1-carboxylate deaminase/D-cysteine desulfhydrase-like pyridoxal-dependent ACC family enzyme
MTDRAVAGRAIAGSAGWHPGWVVSGQRPVAVALRLPSPVVELADGRLAAAGVRLLLKRDDLIHPELPGNKWRKLKYNLTEASAQGHETLLTFGGAYSNHIRATAAAGHFFGFNTIGVVRGEEHLPLNPCLAYAVSRGMRLTYLDRGTYRVKDDPRVIEALRDEWGPFYLLPEGGSNGPAVRGCAELTAEITDTFDVICCPVGTGGTLAGIAGGLGPPQRAIGFSVMKGGEFLTGKVSQLQQLSLGHHFANWHIEYDFHFGGYARTTPLLKAFAADFAARHAMTLDQVYVAKMMFGIFALVEAGAFAPSTRIVAVITG